MGRSMDKLGGTKTREMIFALTLALGFTTTAACSDDTASNPEGDEVGEGKSNKGEGVISFVADSLETPPDLCVEDDFSGQLDCDPKLEMNVEIPQSCEIGPEGVTCNASYIVDLWEYATTLREGGYSVIFILNDPTQKVYGFDGDGPVGVAVGKNLEDPKYFTKPQRDTTFRVE